MNVYEHNLSPSELDTLDARRDNFPTGFLRPWKQLAADVRRAMADGIDPNDAAAQALAERWLMLAVDMTGDDRRLLMKMHALTRQDRIIQDATGIDPTLMNYIEDALVALRTADFGSVLTTKELERLRARMRGLRPQWLSLIDALRARMLDGVCPSDPAARALAERWHDLADATYFAGDAGLRDKLLPALKHAPRLTAGTGIDQAMLEYVWRASVAPLPGAEGEAHAARPSPSAQNMALLRAAHQCFDHPRLFDDPLALRIIGAANRHLLERCPHWLDNARLRPARTAAAVRSRLAEDALAQAIRDGVRQYLVLGAGLDTSAYRLAAAPELRLFEIDRPAMQKAKRALLREAGIPVPETLRYVAADLQSAALDQALRTAGFDAAEPAFVSMLGVAMYLDEAAFWQLLRWLGHSAPGSELVFDFAVAPERLSPLQRYVLNAVTARSAADGEPWRCFVDPQGLPEALRRVGFGTVEVWDDSALHARYLTERADGLKLEGVTQIVRARV